MFDVIPGDTPIADVMKQFEKSEKAASRNSGRKISSKALANLKPWKPGQSGNPAGRPKSTTELKQQAASHTDLAFEVHRLAAELTRMRLQAALDMLADPKRRAELTPVELESLGRVIDPAGLAAAAHILDRGHGKPTQKVEDTRGGYFDGMTEVELAKWVVEQLPAITKLLSKK